MLPEWISPERFDRDSYLRTAALLQKNRIRTVCQEANCPNRYECFSSGTATFLILGTVCTRDCAYCNVRSGAPAPVDDAEPERIAAAARQLNLKHCVITCVTRDDLADAGASHFVAVLQAVRQHCTVELLVSDLAGDWQALKHIVDAQPDILNHNIEVVASLFPQLRPGGDYRRSLALLRTAKQLQPSLITKSGLMVGFGEGRIEVEHALRDVRATGCDILTIGQYLQPSAQHAPVRHYYTSDEFAALRHYAECLGFRVAAGPLVRSSYHAMALAQAH